jgi:molybdopterin molybdotransferase
LQARRRENLISLEEAQALVLEAAAPLDTELVPLNKANGRVLAEEVRSFHDEPAIAQAAVDGYAVRSAEVTSASPQRGILLSVVGETSAGHKRRLEVKQGEAVRVMTGGSVPGGADAVVPQELVETVDKTGIRVMRPVASGDHLIPVGAEFQRGQHFLSNGTVLRAKELSMLAALGCTRVTVRRQPVVAVLATGSELVPVGERLRPGQVFASNLFTVANLVHRCGGKVASLDIAADNLKVLTSSIRSRTKADVVVTTGGTGRGRRDLVTASVAELSGRLLFRGIAMTPGKQTLLAKLGDALLFGLPGRPPATYVAFEQLVRPALLRMLGLSQVFLPEMTATLSHPFRVKGKILSFLFCRLIFGPEGLQAQTLRSETKGMLTEMAAANGLLKVPAEKKFLETGERVKVQLLDMGVEGLSYFREL